MAPAGVSSLFVSWAFSLAGSNAYLDVYGWNLSFNAHQYIDGNETTRQFLVSGVDGFGSYQGTGIITGLDPSRDVVWEMDFSARWVATDDSSTLTLTIPQNSWDIAGDGPVPEPASILLLGAGAGLLVFARRFRRA